IYDIDPQQGCTLQPTTSGRRMFRAASIVPLSPMESGVRETPSGGRIVVASWRFAQGQTLPYMFFDTTHDDYCYVIEIADTHERVCSPLWNGYTQLYQDMSCSTPIIGYPRCLGAWRSQWFPTAPFQWTCDGPAYHVFAYDQPLAGPYYETVDQTCSPADPVLVEPKAQNATQLPTAEMSLVTRRMD